jgi:hypothetical protein
MPTSMSGGCVPVNKGAASQGSGYRAPVGDGRLTRQDGRSERGGVALQAVGFDVATEFVLQ